MYVRTQYSLDPGQAAPPPLSHISSKPTSNIFTFLESLGQMIISGQPFLFEFRKLKTPFWAKNKNVPKCGLVALFIRAILTYLQKRYEAVE